MFWENLYRDLQYAYRGIRRNPGFSAVAVVTLALGIGANTAIFNAIDEALLRPLPLPNPEQLVAIYNFNQKTGSYNSSSYRDYKDFARQNRSLQQLAAYVRMPLDLSIGGSIERVPTEAVTVNYFSTLDLSPIAGRAFRPEDSDASDAVPVAMVAEDLWRNRFQGDPSLVGKTIELEDHRFLVVGIVPRRYRGTNLNWSDPPQVWIPIKSTALILPRLKKADIFHQRSMRWLLMIGRMKAGVNPSQAQADFQVVAAHLAQTEPATNRDMTIAAFSASHAKFWPAYRSSITQSLALFSAAAALVLLLACANVSNLLLERAFGRRREIAVRLSIGAARARIIRQLLTEDVLLVVPSFLLAVAVAFGLEKILLQFPNALGIPLALHLAVGGRMLLFCFLLSFITILLFGIAPALQATKADILPFLKESGNAVSAAFHRNWLRHSLVIVQVAFSMILLVCGGLFVHSLLNAYAIDLGFRPADLLTMAFELPQDKSGGEQPVRFLQGELERISSLAGVETATVAMDLPLTMMRSTISVTDPASTSGPIPVTYNMVGPNYLRTLGISLMSGRDLAMRDTGSSMKVAIVNQTFAKRLWGNGNPVGRIISVEEKPGRPTTVEIAGVAHDSKYESVWEEPEPYLYLAAWQWNSPARCLLVRTRGNPQSLIPAIRQQWQKGLPGMLLYGIRTEEEQMQISLSPQRVAAGFLGAFAILAVILASVGLYSVVAYSVIQRRREVGIRMAIGATPGTVVRHFLGQALYLTGIGLIVGVTAAGVLIRFIASQIKGISVYDPITFAAVASLLAIVTISAASIPAFRAARVDPLRALKEE